MTGMRKITTVLASVAIAAILAAPFAFAGGSSDDRVRLRLIEKGTAFHFIDVRAPAADGQAGDLITFESTLHRTADGPAIGRLEGSCIQIRANGSLDDCGVTVWVGRHSFRMDGPFNPVSGGLLTVVGGTGDWVGASGTDRITNNPNGTAIHDIVLVLN
jgi:hypothetical protein